MLHQATCVAIDGLAILIEGAPGTGKSSLALALIDRGAVLVGDDGVLLELADGRLLASPAPATAGLIEIRNLGLITLPCTARLPVALIITLDEDAPRFIDTAESIIRGGIAVPAVRLWPGSPVLHLRAEHALSTYGTR